MDKKVTITCPCLFGLESVLSFEVKKLGGENITVSDGRVTFEGNLAMVAKANIWLRTAEPGGDRDREVPRRDVHRAFRRDGRAAVGGLHRDGRPVPVKGWSRNSQAVQHVRRPVDHQARDRAAV